MVINCPFQGKLYCIFCFSYSLNQPSLRNKRKTFVNLPLARTFILSDIIVSHLTRGFITAANVFIMPRVHIHPKAQIVCRKDNVSFHINVVLLRVSLNVKLCILGWTRAQSIIMDSPNAYPVLPLPRGKHLKSIATHTITSSLRLKDS